MHLSLILLAVSVAYCIRLLSFRSGGAWSARWQQTLGLFLFSPLLLLITATAVLGMGRQGQMLGLPVGGVGYVCALGFLATAAGCLLWQTVQGWRSLQQIQQHPRVKVQDRTGYLLDTTIPFAAQLGFWQSNLVVSQGLLSQLSPEQIQAVLTHEQAHAYYRDTFWFFWLGWLHQLTAWLPNTEQLWQELLLLREIRADRWAAQQVDALLIAESLLSMTQSPVIDLEFACAAMSAGTTVTRLEERIEALLAFEAAECVPAKEQSLPWPWLLPALIPLLTAVLHQ